MIRKNIFSIIAALILLFLSLTNTEKFNRVPLVRIPHIDKIVHFSMYFFFTAVILYEHRKKVTGISRVLLMALIPFFYGIMMEVLQITVTVYRSGNAGDAIANTAGILTALLLWFLLIRSGKKTFR